MFNTSKFSTTIDGKKLNVVCLKLKDSEDVSTGPIHHVFLGDRSGSMSSHLSELVDHIQEVYKTLVDEYDIVSVIGYSSETECKIVVDGLSGGLVTEFNKLTDKMRTVQGTTCFSVPMLVALDLITRTNRVYNGKLDGVSVTLFTDGCPVTYKLTPAQDISQSLAISELMSNENVLAINTIGYGNWYNPEFLRNLASKSKLGMFTHASKIDQFVPISRESITRTKGTQRKKVNIKVNPGVMALEISPKAKYANLTADDVNKRLSMSHTVYLFGSSGATTIYGEKVEEDTDGQDTIDDFKYGLAYQYYYHDDRKLALRIVVNNLKDKYLADLMINAFTFDEVAVATQALKDAAFNKDARYLNGKTPPNYIPGKNSYSLMDLITDLSSDESYYVPFSEYSQPYERITRKVTDQYNIFTATDKEHVLGSFDDIIYSKEKLNLSLRFYVPGTVQLNPKAAKAVNLDPTVVTGIYRTHTFIKDGVCNIPKATFIVPRPKANQIVSKFKSNCEFVDLSSDEVVKFELDKEIDWSSVNLDLTTLPVIRGNFEVPNLPMRSIFNMVVRNTELSATQKVLKYFSLKYETKAIGKKVGQLIGFTADQIKVLADHGIDKELRYLGVDKVTPKVEDCDAYEIRLLEFVLKGLSTLPKIDDVITKVKDGRKLTISEKFISDAYDIVWTTVIDTDASNGVKARQLYELLKSNRRQLAESNGQLAQVRIATILTNDWFDDIQSSDKGYYFEYDGIVMNVKTARKLEYVTSE